MKTKRPLHRLLINDNIGGVYCSIYNDNILWIWNSPFMWNLIHYK
jgi:hypothetical protein